jgi:hypothetical protein
MSATTEENEKPDCPGIWKTTAHVFSIRGIKKVNAEF